MSSIEHIVLDQAAAQSSFDASTVSGLEKLTLSNHATNTNKTSMTIGANQTLVLDNVTKTGSYLEIAAASSVTAATVVLNKAGDAASGGTALDVELEATGVKTLNLQTTGNASRIALLDAQNTGNFNVETINITGDKDLIASVAASSASKVTIAAGSFTGKLNLDLSATENFEVTGGSGDDRFNFGGAFDASDKVNGGTGTNTVAVNTLTGVAAWIDGKTNGVANNSNIQVLEYTGTAGIALDASAITMSTLKSYKTSGAIVGTANTGSDGGDGSVGLTVTGQSNDQTFLIEGNVTGGAGDSNTGGAGGNGGAGMTFAPAVNNGDNTLNLSLKGVTITGGAGGNGSATNNGGSGGTAADFSNFETINITSTGATATATNVFTGGAAATSGGGSAGSTVVVSANAKINITGTNEINLGNINSSNQPITIDASNLSGKLTVGTGTGADVIKGGSGVNLITLAGGADQVDLTKSTAKADTVTVSGVTATSTSAVIKIAGFTNAATTGDKLDIFGASQNATIQTDVSAGSATGVTNLTASVSNGVMSFTGSAAATATLANKVSAALSSNFANSQWEVVAFEHNGNTYVVGNADGDTTYDAGTDYVIELTGVTGLTALSTTASAANTLFVI